LSLFFRFLTFRQCWFTKILGWGCRRLPFHLHRPPFRWRSFEMDGIICTQVQNVAPTLLSIIPVACHRRLEIPNRHAVWTLISGAEGKAVFVHVIKTYGETEVTLHECLTSPQNGSGQIHVTATLPPAERISDTQCVWGWLGTTAVMEALQERKIPATEILNKSSVDISVLLERHAAAHVGSWLQAFWDELWVLSSRVQQDPVEDTETDYQSTPCNTPKKQRFHLHRNGTPKTRFRSCLALVLVTLQFPLMVRTKISIYRF